MPREPSLGGTGGLEDEYRRWWLLDLDRRPTAAEGRAGGGSVTTGLERARKRAEEGNMVGTVECGMQPHEFSNGELLCECTVGGKGEEGEEHQRIAALLCLQHFSPNPV